jgi:hypothetical protein
MSQRQQNQFPVTDIFSHIDIADGRVWMLPKGFVVDLSEPEQKVVWATHAAPAADLFNQKVEGANHGQGVGERFVAEGVR